MKKLDHDHEGHRLRLKQRFLKEGNFDSFQPHNVLEYLLFNTIPIRDTNELAHKLINHFGSLSGVFDAPYNELLKVEGVGPHTATLIKAILPMARAYATDKDRVGTLLCETEEIIEYLKGKYIGQNNEMISVISMDNRCKLLSFDVLAEGSIDCAVFDRRKFLEIILRTGATCVILAHNHPGGLAFPSEADKSATKTAGITCSSVSVNLIDHIILAGDDGVSMRDSRMCLDVFYKAEKQTNT